MRDIHRFYPFWLNSQTLPKVLMNYSFYSLFFLGLFSCQSPSLRENVHSPTQEEKQHSSVSTKNLSPSEQAPTIKTENNELLPLNERGELLLKDLFDFAYHKNAGIQAARAKWEGSIEKYPQVVSLPNPMLGYRYFYVPKSQRSMIMWSQSVPFPTKLYYEGEIAKEESRMARYEFEFKIREVLVELEIRYYEWCYLTKAIQITQQNQKLLNELIQLAQSDYAQNKAILLDVLKGEQQIAQLSYDLITLEEKKRVEEAGINSLLNRPFLSSLGQAPTLEAEEIHFSLEELQKIAFQEEQELKTFQHRIKRAEHVVTRAKQNYFPDIILELGYETMGSRFEAPPENGEDSYIGLSLELPIWVGKYRAEIREAQKKLEEEHFLKTEKEQNLNARIVKQYYLYENSIRLVKLYKNVLLPQAKQAMGVAEHLYRDAKGTYSDYLESQLVWFNFNLAYQRSLTDQHINKALLEGLAGIRLEGKI